MFSPLSAIVATQKKNVPGFCGQNPGNSVPACAARSASRCCSVAVLSGAGAGVAVSGVAGVAVASGAAAVVVSGAWPLACCFRPLRRATVLVDMVGFLLSLVFPL